MKVRDPETLRAAREAAGLSQRKMAAQVGCSQATLSLIERGHMHTCTTELAVSIAATLSARVGDLFDRRHCTCRVTSGRRTTDQAAA